MFGSGFEKNKIKKNTLPKSFNSNLNLMSPKNDLSNSKSPEIFKNTPNTNNCPSI